jgi:uncharacterized protein (DUF2147 family)
MSFSDGRKTHMKRIAGISLCWAMLVAALAAPAAFAAPATQGALGVWADEEGKSNIEIAPCGQFLCGRIVWLAEPADDNGQLKRDINNPDPAMRKQPIMGLTILKGLQPHDGNTQLKGLVYNAENGKVYDIYLDPNGSTMGVEGCFAMFLCGSQTWTRVR